MLNRLKGAPWWLIGILLAVFFGIALFSRVVLPYDQVFGSDWVKFTSIDAYQQMRLVDNLVRNFPHLNSFDPYFIYPGGDSLDRLHLFNWLLAGIIWLAGLGRPGAHMVDVIGVYFPAVLGALTVIPVYFIGRELFNRWAGLLAAGLLAVMPGEFLGRSILGFTDQHVAETLFSTVSMLLLIMAVKAARQRQLALSHLVSRDRAVYARPLAYSLLAGFSLGVYLITWGGGLLFVFIISLYFVVQFVIDHLRGRSVDYLGIMGVAVFLVVMLVVLPFSPNVFYRISLVVAVLIPLVAWAVSRLMAGRHYKPYLYPLALAALGLAGLGGYQLLDPFMLGLLLNKFSIFFPSTTLSTTLEAQPILSPQGKFTFSIAIGNFTTGFFVSILVILALIIYQGFIRRQDSAGGNLLLVWSLVILLATLAQRRFAYYYAVNVAVLTGYLSWQIIWYAGLRRLVREEAPDKPAAKRRQKASPRLGIYRINASLAAVIVLLGAFVPNIWASQVVAQQARFAPSDAWYSALTWMQQNTPEPFGDAGFYYQRYQPPPAGQGYPYPGSAYGVTAWWDYGYWITRIAHRLPSVNPGQTPAPIVAVANLFLSQDEAAIRQTMAELDSSYIITDQATATGKLWGVITWAGKQPTDFVDRYFIPYGNNLLPLDVYYPEYYRSMYIRLHNFNGKAVTPQSSKVVSYEEKVTRGGERYRQVASLKDFPAYPEALAYVQGQTSGNYRIIGVNPFVSPVPLEALTDYRLVYSSEQGEEQPDVGKVPEVKIFQYLR